MLRASLIALIVAIASPGGQVVLDVVTAGTKQKAWL